MAGETTSDWVDDEGVNICGEYVTWKDGPDTGDIFPEVWIGHAEGTLPNVITISEHGGSDPELNSEIDLERETIPRLVETLVKRAYPRDADNIRERVDAALEEFEADR